MNDTLINFETSKLAKEKGFDVSVIYCYNENEEIGDNDNLFLFNYNNFPTVRGSNTNMYSAPTQSLLQKWLREKHQIIVTITPTFTYSLITHIGYYCTIETPNEDLYRMECKNPDLYFHATYEEALEAGLKEALNLISTENE